MPVGAPGLGPTLQPVWATPDSPARAAHVEPGIEAPHGYAFKKLRSLFGVLDEERMALAGRAYQIAEWARTHRFLRRLRHAHHARQRRVLPALPGLRLRPIRASRRP